MTAKDFVLKEIIDKVGEYVAASNWAACLANLDANNLTTLIEALADTGEVEPFDKLNLNRLYLRNLVYRMYHLVRGLRVYASMGEAFVGGASPDEFEPVIDMLKAFRVFNIYAHYAEYDDMKIAYDYLFSIKELQGMGPNIELIHRSEL